MDKKKVIVVPLSNTVINPGTVVIKALREREGGRERGREGRKEGEKEREGVNYLATV